MMEKPIKTDTDYADCSWNPWIGCHKVSRGCDRCYVYQRLTRYGHNPERVERCKTRFSLPIECDRHGVFKIPDGSTVSVCAMSDFFIPEADGWRDEVWALMKMRPELRFLICTKRPERIKHHIPKDWGKDGYGNVWLGVSVENQEAVIQRVSTMLEVKCGGHFVLAEPLVAPIELSAWMPRLDATDDREFMRAFYGSAGVDWVLCGGECGSGTDRAVEASVVRLRHQCAAAGVPFFFRYWGGPSPCLGGRVLQEREWVEMPWLPTEVVEASEGLVVRTLEGLADVVQGLCVEVDG